MHQGIWPFHPKVFPVYFEKGRFLNNTYPKARHRYEGFEKNRCRGEMPLPESRSEPSIGGGWECLILTT